MKLVRIVLGISGASGFIYGYKALDILSKAGVETHLVVSNSAHLTRSYETNITQDMLEEKAHRIYDVNDVAGSIASGSFRTDGMIIAPCSVKTLSAIANCYSDNLISRAADVTLKERRRLVLMFRETPLHLGHISSMQKVSEMGGIIFPPVPSFYGNPSSIDDIVEHSVARALSLFNLDLGLYPKWNN